MAFVEIEDFKTHIYAEAVAVISRNDETKVEQALRLGQQTVARYLSNYDTATIFSTTGIDKEKYEELTLYIKDIAKWHFIAVCNVSVDYELAKERYEMAIKALEKIQKSSIIDGWAISPKNPEPSAIRSGSNTKWNHS